MPILIKILFPIVLIVLNIKHLVPLLMICVIYGIALFLLSLPLISNQNKTSENSDFKGYIYLGTHIALYILSFGVWQLIWVYRTTKHINSIYTAGRMKPAGNMVMCLFVPFYSVIWSYKIARRIDSYTEQYNAKTKISVVCLLVAFLSDAAASLLIQSRINDAIYRSYKYKFKRNSDDKTCVYRRYRGFEKNHINIIKHIILMFVTCGIWKLIWVCRTTRMLNYVAGEKYRSPAKKMLLCLFIPFYSIYWNYKTAKRVDSLFSQYNLDSDISKACLVSGLTIGSVDIASILIQNKINEIALLAQEGDTDEYEYSKVSVATYVVEEGIEKYHHNMWLYALGSLIFSGIFNPIWVYRTTKVLNSVKGAERRTPIIQMIFCIILPLIYYLFWTWRTARTVDKLAKQYNVDSWIAVPSVVCWFLLGIIPVPYIIQSKLNEIVNVVKRSSARYDD